MKIYDSDDPIKFHKIRSMVTREDLPVDVDILRETNRPSSGSRSDSEASRSGWLQAKSISK